MAQVLLIEPDMLLAQNIIEYLGGLGHDIVWQVDAQSAISSADDISPDVVIVELQLASHSGVEFIYEFRSYGDWANVPIIVLSSLLEGDPGTNNELWRLLNVTGYHVKSETRLQYLGRTINSVLTGAKPQASISA